MAMITKTALTTKKVSVTQSDASLLTERAKLHASRPNISTKVDTTTAAPTPEVTPTPSVSVAQSDANTAADVTHPPADEGDTQDFDKRGMSESPST